uniref:Uncharacterized protein n=1 Tax=Oryza nivara TaxID=4536 RepID=A0A0E0J1P9_ORYNI
MVHQNQDLELLHYVDSDYAFTSRLRHGYLAGRSSHGARSHRRLHALALSPTVDAGTVPLHLRQRRLDRLHGSAIPNPASSANEAADIIDPPSRTA